MKKITLLVLCLCYFDLAAQMNPKLVEITQEQVGKEYKIYARNTNACPVSVFFTFEADNTCGIPKACFGRSQCSKAIFI